MCVIPPTARLQDLFSNALEILVLIVRVLRSYLPVLVMEHPHQFRTVDEVYMEQCERSHCGFCRSFKHNLYGREILSFFNIFLRYVSRV